MFNILKIVQPAWYFNLKPATDPGYFPGPDGLNSEDSLFSTDNSFGENARDAERAYRALRFGILDGKLHNGLKWWGENQFSPEDEYRFARKYFHSSRVWMALLIRLVSFHNPVREVQAFIKSWGSGRDKIKYLSNAHDAFHSFQSVLVKNAPKVTVVIPTLNRYSHLENVLSDFENRIIKILKS